jgi:hypothetical protein
MLKGHPLKIASPEAPADAMTPDTPLHKRQFSWDTSNIEKRPEDELRDIFLELLEALKRLSTAIQDFQDYVDSEGEESTLSFIEHVQVSITKCAQISKKSEVFPVF